MKNCNLEHLQVLRNSVCLPSFDSLSRCFQSLLKRNIVRSLKRKSLIKNQKNPSQNQKENYKLKGLAPHLRKNAKKNRIRVPVRILLVQTVRFQKLVRTKALHHFLKILHIMIPIVILRYSSIY